MEKFRDVTPTSPKVIGANTLNFKPNLTCSPLNILGRPPSPLGVCASKPWSISSACKKFEGPAPAKGRNIVCRKFNSSGSKLTCNGPKLTGLFHRTRGNRSRSLAFRLWISCPLPGDIRDQSLKLYEIGPNFACFWPPTFWRKAPNFWTCIIKRTQIAIMWQSFTAIGRGSSGSRGERNKN